MAIMQAACATVCAAKYAAAHAAAKPPISRGLTLKIALAMASVGTTICVGILAPMIHYAAKRAYYAIDNRIDYQRSRRREHISSHRTGHRKRGHIQSYQHDVHTGRVHDRVDDRCFHPERLAAIREQDPQRYILPPPPPALDRDQTKYTQLSMMTGRRRSSQMSTVSATDEEIEAIGCPKCQRDRIGFPSRHHNDFRYPRPLYQ